MRLPLKDKCETCDSITGLTASHFVKKNSVSKTKIKDYDYNSQENYFTQCIKCHMNFEKYPIRCKLDRPAFNHARTITRQEFLKRKNLISYADRIDYLITL